MKVFEIICWVITLIACCLAAIVLFLSIGAQGAPQQGAGAALAAAIVIIPYVFSRAISELGKDKDENNDRNED